MQTNTRQMVPFGRETGHFATILRKPPND